MALIQFSCIATGPFITFKETAERIFEALGEPFHEHALSQQRICRVFSLSLMQSLRQTENLSRKLKLNVKNGFVQDLTMLSFGRLRLKKNKLTKPSIMKTRSAFTNG